MAGTPAPGSGNRRCTFQGRRERECMWNVAREETHAKVGTRDTSHAQIGQLKQSSNRANRSSTRAARIKAACSVPVPRKGDARTRMSAWMLLRGSRLGAAAAAAATAAAVRPLGLASALRGGTAACSIRNFGTDVGAEVRLGLSPRSSFFLPSTALESFLSVISPPLFPSTPYACVSAELFRPRAD